MNTGIVWFGILFIVICVCNEVLQDCVCCYVCVCPQVLQDCVCCCDVCVPPGAAGLCML